jgi:hypothetical protein
MIILSGARGGLWFDVCRRNGILGDDGRRGYYFSVYLIDYSV